MSSEKNRLIPGRLLLYIGLVVVTFLVGTVFGMVVLGRGPGQPVTPQAMSVPTASPQPATATLEPTTAALPASPSPTVPPPTLVAKPVATATPCIPSPPAGWAFYVVKSGDTLYSLASRANLSQESVMHANCLASPALVVGQRLYLPPLPTPTSTPCVPSPPPGWALYTVRSSDTLFSLAVTRGTSAERASQVNCLSSSSLLAGQKLYLPPLSISYTSPTPAATEPAGNVLNSQPRISDIPHVRISAESPDEPKFIPCQTQKGHPWIHFRIPLENKGGDDDLPTDLEHGQRVYYFACEFPDPSTLTARMTGPDNSMQRLDMSVYLPDPELQMSRAQKVAIWSATCDLPIGPYTLTVQDGLGNQRQLEFNLKDATTRQRILTVPGAGSPATTFKVYYCGYQAQANQKVEIDLCYAAKRLSEGGYEYVCDHHGFVTITADGWAWQKLVLPPGGLYAGYLLLDHEEVLKGLDKIWLVP
jgi:LysM repeat protein